MNYKKVITKYGIALGALGMLSPISVSGQSHDTTKSNSAQKSSTARVNISDGSLSLDRIPHIIFTNEGSSDQHHLHLADATNGENEAQVTDYRDADRPEKLPSQRPGWSLSVSADIPEGSRLKMNGNDNQDSLTARSIELEHGQPMQRIMESNARQGYGVNQIHFDHPDDASLDLPNIPPKDYTINVHWELNSRVNSDVNSVD